MDEVRQSFMAEQEQANRRAALTNSMQELELALERSKVPSPDDDGNDEIENPAAGLEFLLRSVADSVSSTAPDSQGGLLKLIKSFNDQLEQIDAALDRRSS
ncbi:hypothetical protein KEM54_002533 [Ascosphaera aggregata]|nr:hypothetical protein KEM54_002533 [Ascosphaera aggregata]